MSKGGDGGDDAFPCGRVDVIIQGRNDVIVVGSTIGTLVGFVANAFADIGRDAPRAVATGRIIRARCGHTMLEGDRAFAIPQANQAIAKNQTRVSEPGTMLYRLISPILEDARRVCCRSVRRGGSRARESNHLGRANSGGRRCGTSI